MIKRIVDILVELTFLILWFVVIAVAVSYIASGIVAANAGDRRPAILTVSAEARDAEMCLIPAAPPEPSPQPKLFCTDALCKRVKGWMSPTPAPQEE